MTLEEERRVLAIEGVKTLASIALVAVVVYGMRKLPDIDLRQIGLGILIGYLCGLRILGVVIQELKIKNAELSGKLGYSTDRRKSLGETLRHIMDLQKHKRGRITLDSGYVKSILGSEKEPQ